MVTASPTRGHSFDGYLQLFHWTELIQSSPLAMERSVYEVVGGAYRKNNITTMELRFNPMKRNRGGEQDLDHIIAAALRGMDRAMLEYPIRPGPDLLPGPRLSVRPERDHRREGDRLARPGHRRDRHRRARIAHLPRRPTTADLLERARKFGLGITVHVGEVGPVEEVAEVVRAARARPHRPRRQVGLRCPHDGHAARARNRAGDLPHLEPPDRRRLGLGGVPLDLRPVPPQRDPLRHQHRRPGDAADLHSRRAGDARPARHPLLRGAASRRPRRRSQASFVPKVSDVAAALREPATREEVEREEA